MQKGITRARLGSSWTRISSAVSVVVLALAVSAPDVDAAIPKASTDKQNCVIATHGIDEHGNFITDPMVCYSTFAESLRSAGVANVPDGLQARDAGSYATLSDFIIGIHYEYASAGNPSMTVVGSVCGGGGLNVPLSWNDRISSTYNGCPSIIHYEHSGYGGATATTFGVGSTTNISGYMDNRTSSIKYFG